MSKKDKNFYKSGNKKLDEGDFQGAIDYYSKAIELDPENPDIYIKRGDVRSFYNSELYIIVYFHSLVNPNPLI